MRNPASDYESGYRAGIDAAWRAVEKLQFSLSDEDYVETEALREAQAMILALRPEEENTEETFRLLILLAYEREEINETVACQLLRMFRVEFRAWAQLQYIRAAAIAGDERREALEADSDQPRTIGDLAAEQQRFRDSQADDLVDVPLPPEDTPAGEQESVRLPWQREDIAELLHTALRKFCGGKASIIAWNLFHCFSHQTVGAWYDAMWFQLRRLRQFDSNAIASALRQAHQQFEWAGNAERTVLYATFQLFDAQEWENYALFLVVAYKAIEPVGEAREKPIP